MLVGIPPKVADYCSVRGLPIPTIHSSKQSESSVLVRGAEDGKGEEVPRRGAWDYQSLSEYSGHITRCDTTH